MQPRRDNLAVIDDHAVAGTQQVREIGDHAVFETGRFTRPHHEQPRGIPWARRPQGDAVGRQLKIEEVRAHGLPSPTWGKGFYAPIVALTILSGFSTGSPRLILSTFSIPSITLPQTVYWLSRKRASSKQMKNWLSPESGLLARAIDRMPRTCGSLLNSALSFLPEPPVPVPCGQPV